MCKHCKFLLAKNANERRNEKKPAESSPPRHKPKEEKISHTYQNSKEGLLGHFGYKSNFQLLSGCQSTTGGILTIACIPWEEVFGP